MRVVPAFLMLLAVAAADVARAQSDLTEDAGFLPTTIGGKLVRLEALTVRRAGATGRLPIALIAHGWPATKEQVSDMHVQDYVLQARDLARRGWLAVVVMRRGYGASDGLPVWQPCGSKLVMEHYEADADDLAATLSTISQRADADRTRMIAIGVSGGGVAAVALSARNQPGLAAVINVSGSVQANFLDCPKSVMLAMEDLGMSAFRTYGARSRVPNLWIYAKNDSLSRPELVERMRAAFLDGGGNAKLVMLEPEGKEGHNLFGTGSGRRKWLVEMDGFLRFLKLPTWTRADVDALMQKLGAKESDRGFLEGYLAAPSEKALAREKGGTYMNHSSGYRSVEEARQGTLTFCQRARRACDIVMENDRWLGPR